MNLDEPVHLELEALTIGKFCHPALEIGIFAPGERDDVIDPVEIIDLRQRKAVVLRQRVQIREKWQVVAGKALRAASRIRSSRLP
jgi:hypothetical protein